VFWHARRKGKIAFLISESSISFFHSLQQ